MDGEEKTNLKIKKGRDYEVVYIELLITDIQDTIGRLRDKMKCTYKCSFNYSFKQFRLKSMF